MALCGTIGELLRCFEGDGAVTSGLRYLASLGSGDFSAVEVSDTRKVQIDGERVFALHQAYMTRDPADVPYEAHRRYVDIQCLLKGREYIRVRSIGGLLESVPYDTEKDIAFFSPAEGINLLLGEGRAAILGPADLHAPGLMVGAPELVVKVVIKIEVEKPQDGSFSASC